MKTSSAVRRVFVLAAIAALAAASARAQPIAAPVQKWQRGGCTSFCQTGWYASPAVADIDNDGQPDVVWASYDLVALNGATGALKWRATNPDRSWPGVVVADLTGNGTLEVVVGRSSNQLVVHNGANGSVVWSQQPAFPGQSGEVRTLAVADLDNNGSLEIVVGRASGGSFLQLNVFDALGNTRPGWPARRNGEPGFGWGMYNENVAVGDLNGDGLMEIIGPTDTHYITALDRDGNQLPASSIYNGSSPAGPKVWSQVGVHVDHSVDLVGYANCGTEHRPNFANSAPVIADVNGDGVREIVVVGDVYDCSIGDPEGDLYHMPWILKLDRTRWSGSGFDWTVIPTPAPNAGPLSEDFNVIENSVQNAVVADLDNDGFKEILFPSYDGRLHAFWLDKTQHGNWPYVVPGTGIRFAGEPVVADLNNDGYAEVIFTSWPEKGGSRVGKLHVLDYLGNPLHVLDLPAAFGGADWNGGLGAPTLANIDSDADLELVIGTTGSGVVAYDLPGTASARVLWGTGRGSSRRTGVAGADGALSINDVTVAEGNAGPTTASFTVTLTPAATATTTVNWATAPSTATAGSDYMTASGTVTFTAGQSTQPVNVTVNGDSTFETNETFFVNLSMPNGAAISDSQGVGTITNDDPMPSLAINDVTQAETNAGTTSFGFTVTLTPASGVQATVNYTTANVSATAGSDYGATSGMLTFAPGETSKPISVTVNGDTLFESNETFNVTLSGASMATIGDGMGVGTITNDDIPPARVFVSVTGADTNDCSNVATPCRTLGAAIGQVATDGEVIITKSGSYAGATINKGVKISAAPGIVAFSGQPITVSSGGGTTVVLRGLTLKAVTPGTGTGLLIQSAGALFVESCTIDGWDIGIRQQGAAEAFIKDSTIRNTNTGLYATTGKTALDTTRLTNNGIGIASEVGEVAVRGSTLSGSTTAGIYADSSSSVTVDKCQVTHNGAGITLPAASLATLRLSRSVVSGNNVGLQNVGGTLEVSGTNVIQGNTTNTTGTITMTGLQ